MTITRRLTLAALLSGVLATSAVAQTPTATADEQALTAIVQTWAEARSANDAAAMRPLFADKVHRVAMTSGKVESTTRDELIGYFDAGFKGAAKGTRVKTLEIRPVLLSDTAAVVDHSYVMFNADGSKVGVGHSAFVAVKTSGAWKVGAVRYTSAWPAGRAPWDGESPR